jgi:hypothetical protein
MIHLRFQAFQEKSSLILLEIISLFLHLSSIHFQYSRTTISPGAHYLLSSTFPLWVFFSAGSTLSL